MKYIIYCHKNKLNGKIYIGQTSKENPEDRWGNGLRYKRNPKFYNAIQKYGWDNFEHLILMYCSSQESADNMEIFLINYWRRRLGEKNVYNITDGGGGTKGYKLPRTKEWKEKIGKSNSIPVNQYDLNGNLLKTWDSIADAEREIGVRHVCEVCRGKLKKTGGYIWKYAS